MKIELNGLFLDQYPDFPPQMNELGVFVFYRTYSRWLPKQGRRETWKEAVRRAVEYNINIGLQQMLKNGYDLHSKFAELYKEMEELFDNIFNLRQFLSGRTHWVGGAETGVADKFPLANFNCSFLNVRNLSEEQNDLADLFYLLLVGTGVGFKCTKEFASQLPYVRNDIDVVHKEYKPLPPAQRIEHTQLHIMENGYATIWVGDSKEGWVSALKLFFDVHIQDKYAHVHTLKISYNSIREAGQRLETFGGTASGYEPLKEMFEGFVKVLSGELDSTIAPPERVLYNYSYRVKLRPIHILDMSNLIGNNVVVGGVRRTAEIALFDADDWECILAKYGINGVWDEAHHKKVIEALDNLGVCPEWLRNMPLFDANARPQHHRRMSNNSIAFTEKPSREMLNLIYTIMRGEGEPGFVNLEEANRRRPNAEGLNPCAEILLDSYGVCNLTTVNVDAFTHQDDNGVWHLDREGLFKAQRLSARAGLRMTCLDLELPHWDKVQKRDRLTGLSLTGWKDAINKVGLAPVGEKTLLGKLKDKGQYESINYAKELRIPTPLLDTTVKPEGTLSQVAGGVSSGLHESHAPFYIRRIRINANDPLAKAVQSLGWTINPEVGTPGDTYEERMRNARTLVIDFPVRSGATRTKDDATVKEQFDTYFAFQSVYTAHNSSNTITVKPHEWEEVEQIVYDNWDNFVGVSFLSHDGGSYQLAPYETCTEEQYHELKNKMKPFNPDMLHYFESGNSDDGETSNDGCDAGVCPIR